MTAKQFIEKLSKLKTEKELSKLERFFHGNDGRTKALGVKFGDVFNTAKEFDAMPIGEIDKLLDSDFYEVRMGAVSVMDYQARKKKTTEAEKKALYNLYIKRHDRLNNWDFVDRAAVNVVGMYLLNQPQPQETLYKLAKSKDVWKRRTSIVATHAFIKAGDAFTTFDIAELLVNDKEESIHKAVGSWVREAGKKNMPRLKQFLDAHAPSMPRVMLRYAIEKLDKKTKEYYMKQ